MMTTGGGVSKDILLSSMVAVNIKSRRIQSRTKGNIPNVNSKKDSPYVLQIITFWGLPIGVSEEPTFAAMAERAMGRVASIPTSLAVVTTRGMKTSIAVSFIITAEDRAMTGRRMNRSLFFRAT